MLVNAQVQFTTSNKTMLAAFPYHTYGVKMENITTQITVYKTMKRSWK